MTAASDYESKPLMLRHFLSITGHRARIERKIKMTENTGDFPTFKMVSYLITTQF